MNGVAWIILGVLALAFSAFAIPYGFHLKAHEKNTPPQKEVSPTKNLFKSSSIGGDLVSGDKITQNIFPPENKDKENVKQSQMPTKKANANGSNIDIILSEYAFIYSKEHDEFGFRIFGNFDKLLHIQILFRYTDGLHYVSEGKLEDTFYPLINFGELIETTNEVKKDKLGIRLKCHYLSAKDKSKILFLTKEVIKNAFYQFAEIPEDSCLYAEIYNKSRHPVKPEWPW
ncbi:MAG: hypothetical protein KAR45_07095 [Desulfobacteraceae bacterium]|nr:hypothetical protein [Desulfobacteraceae bacterium]